jgi:hypothetical protein
MVSVCGRLAKRVLQLAQSFGKIASMRDVVEREMIDSQRQLAQNIGNRPKWMCI